MIRSKKLIFLGHIPEGGTLMLKRILDFAREVARYEKTAPLDSSCMRCILLWSMLVILALNLNCNGLGRPIVYVLTFLTCLVLFAVSMLLPRVRNQKRIVLLGSILITAMAFVCLLSNENAGFQNLWFYLFPAIMLIQMGLPMGAPVCILYGVCSTALFWCFPQFIPSAGYAQDYCIYYPVFYWTFFLTMVAADLFYKSYRIRREQTEREMEAEVHATMAEAQKLILSSVAAISQMIDEKDRYTSEHSRRVAAYSRTIARHLDPGLSEEALDQFYRSALLHDIGKIAVPDAILKKPSHLTNEEFGVIKQHTVWGKQILAGLEFLPQADVGASYHHERYDGTGYPAVLRGSDLPEMVWIISAADALDAMSSDRCYRKHCDLEYILGEFEKGRGTQFAPDVADAVIELLHEGVLPLGSTPGGTALL